MTIKSATEELQFLQDYYPVTQLDRIHELQAFIKSALSPLFSDYNQKQIVTVDGPWGPIKLTAVTTLGYGVSLSAEADGESLEWVTGHIGELLGYTLQDKQLRFSDLVISEPEWKQLKGKLS